MQVLTNACLPLPTGIQLRISTHSLATEENIYNSWRRCQRFWVSKPNADENSYQSRVAIDERD